MEHILKAVEYVNLERLSEFVYLPDYKQRSDENDTRENLVQYWLLSDPAPSWRRLLQILDWAYDVYEDMTCASAADTIRHAAEPIQGMLFTFLYV